MLRLFWTIIFCFYLANLGVSVFAQQFGPLFVINQNGRVGFIDASGTIVIQPRFKGATDFEGNVACAMPEGESHYAVIDKEGRTLSAPQYAACGKSSNGLLAVAVETAKTRRGCMDCDPFYDWGYVDESGKVVIKPQFHRAEPFAENVAAVENDRERWGFIDKSGRTVIGFRFDYAESFSDGSAVVATHQRFGYIDHHGHFAIGPKFPFAASFSEGLALVRLTGPFVSPFGLGGGNYGKSTNQTFAYIDRAGKSKIRFKAEHASPFSDGLAAFDILKPDGYLYCGYKNNSGRTVIEPEFGSCEDFSEGLALVLPEGNWQFVDKSGRVALDAPFAQVYSFHSGLARFSRQMKSTSEGYINKAGKVVWDPE